MILGFIGTGKIASSVITGISRSKLSFKKIIIFLKESFDLDIPVITEDAIFPVPIKPKIIISVTLY